MINPGELRIRGTIDDTELNNGIRRIELNMRVLENQSNQVNAGFGRIGRSAANIKRDFLIIGTSGVAAFTGIASKSPVLAGSMAQMEVNMFKLSNTAGRILKPIFDTIANELLPSINDALINNSNTIGGYVDIAKSGLKDVSNLITGNITDIDNLGAKTIAVGLGYKLGGKTGALLGGLASETLPSPNEYEKIAYKQQYGAFGESMFLADQIFKVPFQNYQNNPTAGNMLRTSGQSIGIAGAAGAQAVIDFFQWMMGADNGKTRDMASSDGVTR